VTINADNTGDSVTFSGTDANTYTGKTTVNSGILYLNKPANVYAISGPLTIGTGADLGSGGNPIVELQADNQIHLMKPIIINTFGELKLDNHNQNLGSLAGPDKSRVVMGDPPLLTVGFDNTSTTFGGIISGPGTVDKVGTGTWTLTGINTYTGGTIIDDGTLEVDGSIGAVAINPGGALSGTGSTGPVTLSPGVSISPGGSTTGILSVQSIAFPSGSTFTVRINGTNAGTDYDQLQVNGTIDLGGATLNAVLNPTYLPALGTSFTIITSTDTLSGTFAGLPDGATFQLGGTMFQIHYVTTPTGYSVVLDAVAYATSASLTSSLSSSTYGQPVTFTAAVHSVSAAAGTPTGTVTFQEGSNVLASAVPLDAAGQASFTIATLPAEPHTITAQYNPGTGFAGSSASVGQTVNPAPLTVTADDQTKIYGELNPPFTATCPSEASSENRF
jgi:autotransporter-associated beta strand protein